MKATRINPIEGDFLTLSTFDETTVFVFFAVSVTLLIPLVNLLDTLDRTEFLLSCIIYNNGVSWFASTVLGTNEMGC